jgi:hypothetical protein
LESRREKIERATQTANDKFARVSERDVEFRRTRQKALDADAAKTARLRALRLAKEAADKEVAARQEAERRAALDSRRGAKSVQKRHHS